MEFDTETPPYYPHSLDKQRLRRTSCFRSTVQCCQYGIPDNLCYFTAIIFISTSLHRWVGSSFTFAGASCHHTIRGGSGGNGGNSPGFRSGTGGVQRRTTGGRATTGRTATVNVGGGSGGPHSVNTLPRMNPRPVIGVSGRCWM